MSKRLSEFAPGDFDILTNPMRYSVPVSLCWGDRCVCLLLDPLRKLCFQSVLICLLKLPILPTCSIIYYAILLCPTSTKLNSKNPSVSYVSFVVQAVNTINSIKLTAKSATSKLLTETSHCPGEVFTLLCSVMASRVALWECGMWQEVDA